MRNNKIQNVYLISRFFFEYKRDKDVPTKNQKIDIYQGIIYRGNYFHTTKNNCNLNVGRYSVNEEE